MTDYGLDLETYSNINLPEQGMNNYMADESFVVMCACIDSPFGTEEYDLMLDKDAFSRFQARIEEIIEDPDNNIVAHNAPFERLALKTFWGMNIDDRIKDLIMLFSVPNEWNHHSLPTSTRLLERAEQWLQYIDYCGVDAKGSRELREIAIKVFGEKLILEEDENELVTYAQNVAGWPTDLPLIKQMDDRAWANSFIERKSFWLDTDTQLNFNSPVQLKKYCAERGFPVKSLDKYQLPLALEKVTLKLQELSTIENNNGGWTQAQVNEHANLIEVQRMLRCKQELGGTSLSKLKVIQNLVSADGRLRDQYVHVGAGQTFRTSGRGVQMQNLKKLGGKVRDMDTLFDYDEDWSNTDMADQLRQVFVASNPKGELIVGDFSAVESRGLAYQAGEEWKLDAYRKGQDVYCALVTRFKAYDHLSYEEVADKSSTYYSELRPRGKYSELSCGYQASGKAVQAFMFRLGFVVPLEEAAQNVLDWRGANPAIVQYWLRLDDLLRQVVWSGEEGQIEIGYGMTVKIRPTLVPTLTEMHPGAQSLIIQMLEPNGNPIVTRIIHGVYFQGNALCYYKPEETLGGGRALWTNLNKTETAKQKHDVLLRIYGGKLAGILTQSLCRELFFDSMRDLHKKLERVPNAEMIGQFHDEIVVDWRPMKGGKSKDEVKALMEESMSKSRLEGFPLAADIKSAYRYIK